MIALYFNIAAKFIITLTLKISLYWNHGLQYCFFSAHSSMLIHHAMHQIFRIYRTCENIMAYSILSRIFRTSNYKLIKLVKETALVKTEFIRKICVHRRLIYTEKIIFRKIVCKCL